MKVNSRVQWDETIMEQCEKLAQEIRKVKERKDVASAWRLRRLEKSLYSLVSRL